MEALLFFVGFIHGSLIEYLVHRYLFHGLGKKKDSIFAYHLRLSFYLHIFLPVLLFTLSCSSRFTTQCTRHQD